MGKIRSVESLALAMLRLIGEEARKDRTAKVIAQLPVDVATYLMNEKRDWLNGIETRSWIDIVLVPNSRNPHFHTNTPSRRGSPPVLWGGLRARPVAANRAANAIRRDGRHGGRAMRPGTGRDGRRSVASAARSSS